jgi:hypothetical protein
MNHKDTKGTKNGEMPKGIFLLRRQNEFLCALRAFVVQMEVLP